MKVLVAVDGKQASEKMFDWYLSNLYQDKDEIYVCHEADHPQFPIVGGISGAAVISQQEINRIVGEHQNKLNQLADKYAKKCSNKNIQYKVIVDTAADTVGHALISRAEKIKADMIVVGSRGLGVLGRTFLGSVSNYVLHHAKVPVLICRDN